MSRKSVVKGIRDIFENESDKSPATFKPTCDRGDNRETERHDQINSKRVHQNRIRSTSHKYDGNKCVPNGVLEDYLPKYGTIKDRISKLNRGATLPKASTIFPSNLQANHPPIHCSPEQNSLIIKDIPKATPKIQKKQQCDKKNNSKNGSDTIYSNKQTNSSNGTKINTDASKKPARDDVEKVPVEHVDSCRKPTETKNIFPVIPPKPKYFNKIIPHPDMPSSTRKQLKDKISLFNSLSADCEKQFEIPTSSQSTPCTSPRHKEIWNFKSEQKSCGITENSGIANNTNLVPKSSCNDHYDIIQNNSSRTELRASPKPPPTEEGENDAIQSRKSKMNATSTSKTNKANSKTAKNIKNIRTMSKDHSLEDEGYVVVDISESNDDNFDVCSEDSSDEELATEYDVIENLNVTKITVERRYKVTDNAEEDPSTFNVKRETYYDHNLNPRIEKISRQMQRRQDNRSNNVCSNRTCSKKSTYILQELVESELVYFTGLIEVYEDYITYFKDSPDICAESMSKVFGNFEEIYRAQLSFYGELTECKEDVDAIAATFLRNESLFSLYEKYVLNMHNSQKYSTGECLEAIKARDVELGNKLNLESYLLTPFQRLIRYRLLLKNLQDALENEDCPNDKLVGAISYLDNFIEGTNLYMKIVQGIQNSPVDLSGRGKLLMMDDCFLRNNGKKYLSTVILFEDIIIFTRKMDADTYIYKGSIGLSDLYVRSIKEELTSFQLQNFTQFKKKHDNKYVYDLEVIDPETKREWIRKLESLLWVQFAACRKR